MATIFAIALSVLLVALNLVATRTVLLSDIAKSQKIVQCLLTWLMPILGAVLVLSVNREHPQAVRDSPEDENLFDTFVKSAPFDHQPDESAPHSDGP
jgi:hypothetical protein